MNRKIYTSSRNNDSFFSLWREMVSELVSGRELIWRLFVRDFLAKYKQAAFGIAWALIMPVAMVGVFLFLSKAGVLIIGTTNVPYPVYALVGLTIWQLFATGISTCSNSIVAGGSMVVKINFAKESLIIASFAQSIFEFIVRAILLAAVFAWYGIVPHWTSVFFPLMLIPLVLLTIGLGFITSLVTVILRDMQNIIVLATTILLFLTPVLYIPVSNGAMAKINEINPLAILIGAPRDMLLTGSVPRFDYYIIASVLSAVIFLAGWRVFHIVEPRMAERA